MDIYKTAILSELNRIPPPQFYTMNGLFKYITILNSNSLKKLFMLRDMHTNSYGKKTLMSFAYACTVSRKGIF